MPGRSIRPARSHWPASWALKKQAFEFCDVVCLNRYLGWYSQSGNLEEALPLLSAELDALHAQFGKPLILTEFGADALPGQHAQPPEMFSEEYQADLLERYHPAFAPETLRGGGACLEPVRFQDLPGYHPPRLHELQRRFHT